MPERALQVGLGTSPAAPCAWLCPPSDPRGFPKGLWHPLRCSVEQVIACDVSSGLLLAASPPGLSCSQSSPAKPGCGDGLVFGSCSRDTEWVVRILFCPDSLRERVLPHSSSGTSHATHGRGVQHRTSALKSGESSFGLRCISSWMVSPEAFSSSSTPVRFKLNLPGSVSFLVIARQGQDHLPPQGS